MPGVCACACAYLTSVNQALNVLCLCLFLFHKCKPGLFHLIAHLVILCLFLCYLNFLCLCLFLFHKCEPGLFHLIAHLVFLCLFLCYLNFLCLCLFLFHKCEADFDIPAHGRCGDRRALEVHSSTRLGLLVSVLAWLPTNVIIPQSLPDFRTGFRSTYSSGHESD